MSLLLTFGKKKSVIQRAISVLRKFGTNAHAYIPGVGVLNGMTAGNYTDSGRTTPGSKDQPVGGVTDALDGIHATQGTAGNKPVLRQGLVCRSYPSGDITLWDTTAAGTITGGQADPVGGTSAQLFSGANTNVYITAGAASGVLSGLSFTHAAHLYSPTGGTLTMGSAAGGAKTTLVTIPAGWSIATAYWTATETNGPLIKLNGSLTSVTVYRQGIYLGTVTGDQILAAGGIPLTTSAKASAGTGPQYWEFGGDGTPTDYLGLGSVPFQMSDDHWVVVASSCVASGAIYTVADLAGKSTGQRCAAIYYDLAGRIVAAWTDDTIAPKTITHGSSLAGVVSVATAVKIGNNKRLRINGVQSGSVESSVMGTTTINVGGISRSVWPAQYLNGNIYAVLCGKGAITDADLLLIEKLAANLAGIAI